MLDLAGACEGVLAALLVVEVSAARVAKHVAQELEPAQLGGIRLLCLTRLSDIVSEHASGGLLDDLEQVVQGGDRVVAREGARLLASRLGRRQHVVDADGPV